MCLSGKSTPQESLLCFSALLTTLGHPLQRQACSFRVHLKFSIATCNSLVKKKVTRGSVKQKATTGDSHPVSWGLGMPPHSAGGLLGSSERALTWTWRIPGGFFSCQSPNPYFHALPVRLSGHAKCSQLKGFAGAEHFQGQEGGKHRTWH